MMDEGARSAPNHKRPLLPDGELLELLWEDGAVVAQAQKHRRFLGSGGNPGTSCVTGEDAAAWFPDVDALDDGRDLYSQLWHSIANVDGRADREAGAFATPPPSGSGAGSSRTGEVGSSISGSNAVAAPALRADDGIDGAPVAEEEEEPGASSAATGSGSNALFKRGRDELHSRSEDADCETVDETLPLRRPAKRRARAAEVHNQSERRRRDRINEKMRALQELVPHCNKTDKASILDETIEYLKSLQLQIQIMWMTTGVAPMIFPGAHQLMSPMAMGLNSACMPVAQSLSQLQRVPPCINYPLPNQVLQAQPPAINTPNAASQMQNNGMFEPRNPFLHPGDKLTAAIHLVPDVPGMFLYGSQTVQKNEIHELLASTTMPASGAQPPNSSDRTGT